MIAHLFLVQGYPPERNLSLDQSPVEEIQPFPTASEPHVVQVDILEFRRTLDAEVKDLVSPGDRADPNNAHSWIWIAFEVPDDEDEHIFTIMGEGVFVVVELDESLCVKALP